MKTIQLETEIVFSVLFDIALKNIQKHSMKRKTKAFLTLSYKWKEKQKVKMKLEKAKT